MAIKISRLIQYLEHIQNTYGDLPISGNIISGERMDFVSMFVEDNTEYNDGYELVLELEEITQDIPSFDVYEYPSNKTIEL